MEYFIINDVDYSPYVNALKVNKTAVYNSQTNASGSTVADYICTKRVIEVGIIPLDADTMVSLQKAIESFNVHISFLNPVTGELEQNVECIVPEDSVEYYTIRANKVLYKAFNLTFIEL